jgi:holo-[acyl-carrier protein] synthase
MIEQLLAKLNLSHLPESSEKTLDDLICSKGAREEQILFDLLPTSSGIQGVGIDIVFVPRIAQLIKRYDRHTLAVLFTPTEIDRCNASSDCNRAFALCFAAKEAVGKALGTGLVGIDWNEIEAIFTPNELAIELYGKAKVQAKRNEVQRWLASWCEWNEHILVHILALSNEEHF